MQYEMDNRPGISFMASFFILLGLLGVGLLVGSLVAGGIMMAMTGTSFFGLEKAMSDPANVQALRVVQLVSTFFIFFIPAWLTSFIIHKRPFAFMGYNWRISWKQLVLAILIMLAALPLVSVLADLNKLIPLPASVAKFFKDLDTAYADQVKMMATIKGFGDYLWALVVIAFAPAIFEETFFRGGMQNLLSRATTRFWMPIIVTSVIFSVIHFSWDGFISRILLGVVLGLLYAWSGSIWTNIIAHGVHNGLIVTQLYWLTMHGKSLEAAENESFPWWAALFATILLVLLLVLYKRISDDVLRRKTPAIEKAHEEKWIA
jgi:membrane protease YdiL (CAAX protease family)